MWMNAPTANILAVEEQDVRTLMVHTGVLPSDSVPPDKNSMPRDNAYVSKKYQVSWKYTQYATCVFQKLSLWKLG